MDVLETIDLSAWDAPVTASAQERAAEALEQGKILYLPALAFQLSPLEATLLSPEYASGKAKNISFDLRSGELRGTAAADSDREKLASLLRRFAEEAVDLLGTLVPKYRGSLQAGRTSFRPVEIRGRVSSYRKDDTRLHVDAFPSTPVGKMRILRIFSNVNPEGKERVWCVGEAFEHVAKRFLPEARKQLWGEGALLQAVKITKRRRTAYDHAMLQLHNRMKADTAYQASVAQTQIRFPAGSTWIVFTDQVSHAAMSGQHVLEQTIYLPLEAMSDPGRSPQKVLERLAGASFHS